MKTHDCDQCGGYGHVPLDEDGRCIEHACYRCGTTGKLPGREPKHTERRVYTGLRGKWLDTYSKVRRDARHDEDFDGGAVIIAMQRMFAAPRVVHVCDEDCPF